MFNAQITHSELGFDGSNLFISLTFSYKKGEDENNPYVTVSTKPIALVEQGQNLMNSSAAYGISLILDTIECGIWEKLIGSYCQIELDQEGNIVKIANIFDEKKFIGLGITEVPTEEVVPEVVAEPVEVVEE